MLWKLLQSRKAEGRGQNVLFGGNTLNPRYNAAATFNVWSSDDTIAINRPYLKIYYPSQTGIHENTLNAKVYPNPCGDILKIEIDQIDDYYLSDVTGRRFELPFSESTKVFDTSSLKSGVYILSLEKNNVRRSYKILKE